jgi:RimJ/RimL family protein N-acetyltransferase
MLGEHFDRRMEQQAQLTNWAVFAVLDASGVVGTTSYIPRDAANGVVEIGATYIAPRVRGSSVNGTMKQLMIEHAFAQGYHRIEFRVDERNQRSQAAVLKLGATREGTLRGDRVTWTGYRRNTCIFSLLRGEWNG